MVNDPRHAKFMQACRGHAVVKLCNDGKLRATGTGKQAEEQICLYEDWKIELGYKGFSDRAPPLRPEDKIYDRETGHYVGGPNYSCGKFHPEWIVGKSPVTAIWRQTRFGESNSADSDPAADADTSSSDEDESEGSDESKNKNVTETHDQIDKLLHKDKA